MKSRKKKSRKFLLKKLGQEIARRRKEMRIETQTVLNTTSKMISSKKKTRKQGKRKRSNKQAKKLKN